MDVDAVTPVCNLKFLTVPHDGSQHAQDMTVRDAAFFVPAVISAEHIVVFTHFQDPMQHILSAVTAIKGDVVFSEFSCLPFYNHKISALTNKREHTVAHVGINKLPLFFKDLLKGTVTHPEHRSYAVQPGLLPRHVLLRPQERQNGLS